VFLVQNLREMERSREAYWLRYPVTSPTKLRWRALTFRHSFHVLPGERILELGAGSGIWTEHLAEVLRGGNPITGVVFCANQRAAMFGSNMLKTWRGTWNRRVSTMLSARQFYATTDTNTRFAKFTAC
jgi:hypothetical protein